MAALSWAATGADIVETEFGAIVLRWRSHRRSA
jgi:hypothetical protein